MAPGRVHNAAMRIAKPLLMVTTPVGVVWGLIECHRIAGGLVFIMFAMLVVMAAAAASVVAVVRSERRKSGPPNGVAP